MKDLNLHALSAHVVAWHNRHPLARRITAAQVCSVGYVALPFLAGAAARAGTPVGAQALAQGTTQTSTETSTRNPPAGVADTSSGATLRERAMARAQGTETGLAPPVDPARAGAQAAGASHAPAGAAHAPAGAAHAPPGASLAPAGLPPAPAGPLPTLANAALAPAFSEDFIAPLSPSRVARWAAVQGVALATPPAGVPVRLVAPDGTAPVARLLHVWVLTAQLEAGRSRTRVLVGAGDAPSVLGRRLWSRARIAALAALGATLLAGALALQFAGTAVPGASAAAAAAAGASAAAAASTPAPAAPASSPPASATGTAAATAAAARIAEPTRPADVEPTLGRVSLPPIGPRADERRKATEQAAQADQPPAALPLASPAATSAATSAATAAATLAATSAASSATAAAATSRPPTAAGPAFAVSTRLLRTRTESNQVAAAMRALLVTADMPQMQVEVLPAGEDWRVVGWPYADRVQAEKARALLAGRGMRVEVIDF